MKPRYLFAILPAMLAVLLLWPSTAQAQEDVTPPVLVDATFEPEVFDTGKSAQTITVTVHMTDDLSGVEHAALFFRNPETTQKNQVGFRPGHALHEPIEGDALNGWYAATMTLPRYSAYGEWEMYSVVLIDNVGNRADFWKPDNEAEAKQGSETWPVLFNSIDFQVSSSSAPQRTLYLPALLR